MTLIREVTLAIDNKPEDWRQGQAAFNALYKIRPDLADSIRGHFQLDPFHRDERLPAFFDWLSKQD